MVDGLSVWMRYRLDRLKLSIVRRLGCVWFWVTDEISSLVMKLSGDGSHGNDDVIAGTGEFPFSIPVLCFRRWQSGGRVS